VRGREAIIKRTRAAESRKGEHDSERASRPASETESGACGQTASVFRQVGALSSAWTRRECDTCVARSRALDRFGPAVCLSVRATDQQCRSERAAAETSA
jgi:hypothetical protein